MENSQIEMHGTWHGDGTWSRIRCGNCIPKYSGLSAPYHGLPAALTTTVDCKGKTPRRQIGENDKTKNMVKKCSLRQARLQSKRRLTRAEGRAQVRPVARLLPARAFCIVMEAIVTEYEMWREARELEVAQQNRRPKD